jgi:hypothetical protein
MGGSGDGAGLRRRRRRERHRRRPLMDDASTARPRAAPRRLAAPRLADDVELRPEVARGDAPH